MPSSIKALLQKHGPSLTKEVADMLEAEGLSNAAARQRITRSQSEYVRLAGIRLEKNARFIYLQDQFGSPEFWEALERALSKSGKSYWATIAGLKARGGICPKFMFPSVCGAPLTRKGQLSPALILERLQRIQLLQEVTSSEPNEKYICFGPYNYHIDSLSEMNAIMIAENVLMHGVKDYARNMGFGSYNKFAMREDEDAPVVSGVQWDLSAPSYMRPLSTVENGIKKPGFFVCDINLRGPISEDTVKVLIRKHDMASAPQAVAPIMPFLVGDVFTQGGLDLARQYGVIAATVTNLFGSDTARALRDLIQLLSDTGATVSVNPEHLYKVMSSLTKFEGAAGRIRGSMFELAIGTLVKDVEGGYLITGQVRTDFETGRKAEIDVFLDREHEDILVIECKSKIPGSELSIDIVQKWYDDRVPLIYNILSADPRYEDRKLRFEIWSNAPFEKDAEEWLQKQKNKFEHYSLGWKDGQALKEYAKKTENPSIRKILKEHYFNHPLRSLKRNTR